MITFVTQSGSVYEIEPLTKLARCVVGRGNTRLGRDTWHRYSDYVQLPDGRLIIELADAEPLPGSPDCALPCIMTSRVVEVRS